MEKKNKQKSETKPFHERSWSTYIRADLFVHNRLCIHGLTKWHVTLCIILQSIKTVKMRVVSEKKIVMLYF